MDKKDIIILADYECPQIKQNKNIQSYIPGVRTPNINGKRRKLWLDMRDETHMQYFEKHKGKPIMVVATYENEIGNIKHVIEHADVISSKEYLEESELLVDLCYISKIIYKFCKCFKCFK